MSSKLINLTFGKQWIGLTVAKYRNEVSGHRINEVIDISLFHHTQVDKLFYSPDHSLIFDQFN